MGEQIDLERARQICEAATPGPWEWDEDEHGNCFGIKNPTKAILTTSIGSGWGWDNYFSYISDWCPTDEDKSFITEARTLLPASLTEIERLREENERLKSGIRHAITVCWDYEEEQGEYAAPDLIHSLVPHLLGTLMEQEEIAARLALKEEKE